MRRLALLAVLPLVVALTAPPTAAHAADADLPTALVTMGDSYISGEAGRWDGNSTTFIGSRRGTDRAFTPPFSYRPERVYGTTAARCHRSDVAPGRSASAGVDVVLNLACSGASSSDVVRAANGGTSRHGEAPQADQLARVAADHDVEVVVLSVGGNDLGFRTIILACAARYTAGLGSCQPGQQRRVDAQLPVAMDGVRRAVDEVRAVLAEAGQAPDSYRMVLQTYPSPIPLASQNRYPQSGWSRVDTGGCPFSNADSDWARSSLVPQISNALAAVAAEKGVQLLDLSSAFDGREACATASAHSTGRPSGATQEWVRFLTSGATQGTAQESLHPNAFGQRAIGRCYTLLVASPSQQPVSCRNTAGRGPEGMRLQPHG